MNPNLNIIDRFLEAFSQYIDSGFGLLGPDVAFLTTILIGIDITLAGLWWALDGDQDILGRLIKKILYVGVFALILTHFQHFTDVVYRSFSGLGITAGGGGVSADDLMHPGALAALGFKAAHPLFDYASTLMGFPDIFGNLLTFCALLIGWLIVVLAFFILAIQLFVCIIEFKLTALAGFVLVPFALWNKTSFLAERVLGNVISSGIKIMMLAVIVGIGTNFFAQSVAALPAEPDVADAMTLVLGALALFGLGIFAPGIAAGLVSGAPQLGAGAAVGTAAGAAMIGMGGAALGARAIGAVAGGGLGAIRAATSMGTAASTAYQSAAATSGQTGVAKVAAGLGGVARTAASSAGSAASQALGGTGKVSEAFTQGRAWRMPDQSASPAGGATATAPGASSTTAGAAGTGSTSAQPPTSTTADASGSTPAWARKLRAEQSARHHRQVAIQTIKAGDRPGGAANPDLSQKD